MWWRGIDKNIASTVHSCLSCQSVRNKPPQATLQPWDWQRVHIDFAVPFMNKMLKVVVDCHSKWLEVDIMPDVTKQQQLNSFATYLLDSEYRNAWLATKVHNFHRVNLQNSQNEMELNKYWWHHTTQDQTGRPRDSFRS